MSWSRLGPPFLGALGLAAAALLALGGAAVRPGGLWLGAPPLAAALVVVCVAAALLTNRRSRAGLVPSAGLLLPAALLLAGVSASGVAAVSGPVLGVLVLAAVAIVVARVGWRPGKVAFLPLAFLVLVAAAGRTHVEVGPRGDEPHYLMVAESLLCDGDLALEGDYAEERYALFHDSPLRPHYRVRGRHGEIYSLHALGLSLLILPAWGLAGYAGVTVFMALVAALLAREVREWTAQLCGREDLADAAGWLLVVSPPLIHYAGLVFTEVPAALAVAYGLRRGCAARLGWRGALALGIVVAALPWLNVRYAPLALLVGAHALWRQRHAALPLVLPGLVSAALLAWYHMALYGFWDPRRVYGRRPELALATLAEGLPGLLLDQEFGLLVYAPLFVLALPGLAFLIKRDRRIGAAALVAVVVVLATAGSWHMWRGGFNPPGRFLVPIVPILALGVALVFERRGLSAGAALLVGWSVWTGLAGAAQPRLVHRDRDGTAPFFRRLSGAREWTGLLPGYVLADPNRDRLALVWGAALVLAVPWRSRRAGALRLAGAGLGMMAAAQAAASLSGARTDERDAVRLVGRAALSVPGWQPSSAAPAEWPAAALGWGPLYEPHRHPAGAPLGRRLPLRPGGYLLVLEGENLASEMASPVLEVATQGSALPARMAPLQRTPAGLTAAFEVRAHEGAVDLGLRGGGPILLSRVRLVTQPSGE